MFHPFYGFTGLFYRSFKMFWIMCVALHMLLTPILMDFGTFVPPAREAASKLTAIA